MVTGDLIGRHRLAIIILVMPGDAGAQNRVAFRFGITELAVVEGRVGCLENLGRRAATGLTRFHVHDGSAVIRHLIRRFENFHGVKRRYIGSLGYFHLTGILITVRRRWRGHNRGDRFRTCRFPGCAASRPDNGWH